MFFSLFHSPLFCCLDFQRFPGDKWAVVAALLVNAAAILFELTPKPPVGHITILGFDRRVTLF